MSKKVVTINEKSKFHKKVFGVMHKKQMKFCLPLRCKLLEFSVKCIQDFVEIWR